MKTSEMNLFYAPAERLRLTIENDRSYIIVKPVWAAPLSHPGAYLALLDGKGDEILLLTRPEELPPNSLQAAQRELRQRYLTATILAIPHARQEYGATYWNVVTDRGEREFVTQSLQENAQWVTEHHLLLVDVDGNRFEIPDTQTLDARSRDFINEIL